MFTDEELEAAVLRYLTSDVHTERTAAGTRDIGTAKTQVYEIISAAFLLRPSALFSVCWMASNVLRAKVIEQLDDLAYILDAAPRVSKTSQRVESTTDLYNAEASLVTLTAAFSARSAGVAGGIGPAIQRFSASVERFIRGELVKNTVEGGDVVHTPEELRVELLKRWEGARVRHTEIVDGVARLVNALGDYTNVRLPDTVVGSLLVRIQSRLGVLATQMNATTAPQHSRNALLELSAMRTLLKQAARFKPPELKKAPVTGDAPTGLLTGSSGAAASILGAVSGPYNYAPGSELTYSVAGAPRTLVLPRTSLAELRSRTMVVYTDPPADSMCAMRNALGVAWQVLSASWGSGEAAATALDAGLLGITVLWDDDANQLVFRSDPAGDAASLVLLNNNEGRAAFATWLDSPLSATGAPVPTQEVLLAFAADPQLKATVESGSGTSFSGKRSPELDETKILRHRVVEGTELTTDGTSKVRATVDLEALGVEPGMVLYVAGYHRILAVAGDELLIDDTLLLGGPVSYYIGPDYTGLEPGTRVHLSGTVDAGIYRVEQGSYAQLRLDRVLNSADAVQASITWEHLRLTLRDVSATSTLEIQESAGATALGFATETALPGLDTFDTGLDLGAHGVMPGDLLELEHAVGAPSVHTVTALEGTSVRFTPSQPQESGPLRYAIRDARVQDYLGFRADLMAVQADETFDNSAELDQTVARLSRGARFTGTLVTALAGYVGALGELLEACDDYVVPRDPTVEQALRVMVEHGFDRAADMFIALRLTEFFALDADGVSYRTHLYREAAEVARLVVPVSKASRDPTQMWRGVAIQPANDGRG